MSDGHHSEPVAGPVMTLEGHNDDVMCVAIFDDGRRAISGAIGGEVKLWDLTGGRLIRTFYDGDLAIYRVIPFADGQRALAAGTGVNVWDLATGGRLGALRNDSKEVEDIVLHAGEKRVLGASGDHLVIWELGSGELLHRMEGHTSRVTNVTVYARGTRALSSAFCASQDWSVRVWDLERGCLLRTLEGELPTAPFETGAVVYAEGQRALTACGCDPYLLVWDLETGRLLQTLGKDEDVHWNVPAHAVVYDREQRVIVASDYTDEGCLTIWDLPTGKLLHKMRGHTKPARQIVVYGDGRRAITASEDHTLKVWDLTTGRLRCTLAGHSAPVGKVAVDDRGRRAVSASLDHTLKVWDLDAIK